MSRHYNNRKKEKQESGAFKKLIRFTFLLALVFSAGLIVGKRIGSGEAVVPLVAMRSTTSEEAIPVIDTGEEHVGTDYSFYQLLSKHDKKEKSQEKQDDIADRVEEKEARGKDAVKAVTKIDTTKVIPAKAPERKPVVPAKPVEVVKVAAKPVEPPKPVAPPKPVEALKPAPKALAANTDIPKPTPKAAKTEEDVASDAKYTLQIGSHTKRADADQERQMLAKLGVKPYVLEVKAPRGVFYRVRVGKYATLADARRAQSELQNSNNVSSFVSPI